MGKGVAGVSLQDFLSTKTLRSLVATVFLLTAAVTHAEPWLDTRNTPLRVDIELLSSASIITVPINTWPLMWAGILNNLESYDQPLPPQLQNSFGRVLTAGRQATREDSANLTAKLSLATGSQFLRHYGDDTRDQGAISLSRTGLTDHFAYNLEVTRVHDAWDGDQTVYDNSYFGFVLGNWIGLVGNIEKWWGPGWNSSLILTNNARPAPGFTLQRNYSDPFELPVLKWLGPWTTSIFIAQLDDERVIDNAKLVGMTLGFRPVPSLEINFRRTAQWGGEGRPQGFKNFVKLVTGISDNCGEADCKQDEPGNQLGAIDLSWDIPWVEGTLFAQTLGEDESGALPSRSSRQYGFKKGLSNRFFTGQLFIEHDNTSTVTFRNSFNILYNHSIYRTGYRYQGRVIGATWDNDTKVTSIGLLGSLNNGDAVEARYTVGDMNIDSINGLPSNHSISTQGADFSSFAVKWRRDFPWGKVEINSRYTDSLIDEFGRQGNNMSLGASLTHRFD